MLATNSATGRPAASAAGLSPSAQVASCKWGDSVTAYAQGTKDRSHIRRVTNRGSLGTPLTEPGRGMTSAVQPAAVGKSPNWTGFVEHEPSGHWYGQVSESWKVPTVPFHQTQQRRSVVWPGIGSGNGTRTRLIQAGTEQDTYSDGTSAYFWWYEIVPGLPRVCPVPYTTIRALPGNSVQAKVTYTPHPTHGTFTATFELWNHSLSTANHVKFSVTFSGSSGQQAEAILERPCIVIDNKCHGYYRLAYFSTVNASASFRTEGRTWCSGRLPNTRYDMYDNTYTTRLAHSRWTDTGGCTFQQVRR
jgi:Peptidase A4 family